MSEEPVYDWAKDCKGSFDLCIDSLKERLEKSKVVIGNCTLYNEDCNFVLPTLSGIDAVVTDPPYGLGEKWQGGRSATKARWKLNDGGHNTQWDNEIPDNIPAILDIAPNAIIWGGHYFGLPMSRAWLVWNKIIRNWSSGECELAWTNLDQPIRAFDCSHGELAAEGKLHPTQKPLTLMKWCIEQLPSKARVILDPFMGGGSTGVACVKMGKKFIGIEREQEYFDIACRRIEEAYKQPDMFISAPEPKPVQESLL